MTSPAFGPPIPASSTSREGYSAAQARADHDHGDGLPTGATDGQVLTADHTAPNGIKWAAGGGGSAKNYATRVYTRATFR